MQETIFLYKLSINGGTLSGAASWIAMRRFPQFSGRENKSGSLVERINGCMERR